MSIKILNEVWQAAQVGGSKLLVLLALADFADDRGGAIYPSMTTIAAKARLSVDQTRRIIHYLVEAGHITIVEDGGWDGARNRPNHYRIATPDPADVPAPVQGLPLQDASTPLAECKDPPRADASTGTRADARTVPAPAREDPSLIRHSDPSSSDDDDDGLTQVLRLWQENFPDSLTPVLTDSITALVAQYSADAAKYAITASVRAGVRKFSYVATCAANYVPGQEQPRPGPAGDPPPALDDRRRYLVDVNGSAPPAATTPRPLPTPTPSHPAASLWDKARWELGQSWPREHFDRIMHAELHEYSGDCYELRLPADSPWLDWVSRAEPALRRTLSSLLGRRISLSVTLSQPEHAAGVANS